MDRPCVAPRTPNPGLARTVQEVQRALASASADFQAAIGLATAAVAAQEAERQRWEVLTAALHRRLAVQQEESADFSAVLMGWAVSLGPLTRPVPRPLASRRGWLSWFFWTSITDACVLDCSSFESAAWKRFRSGRAWISAQPEPKSGPQEGPASQ